MLTCNIIVKVLEVETLFVVNTYGAFVSDPKSIVDLKARATEAGRHIAKAIGGEFSRLELWCPGGLMP